MVTGEFERLGWARFAADAASLAWARAAREAAQAALVSDQADWRASRTWFVGVDALCNDATGAVAGVPLAGAAADWVRGAFGPADWHRAQLSAVRPGYPGRDPNDSDSAYEFRLRRDAAHVDGLIADGTGSRYLLEPHRFIFGIALTESDAGAAPLAVWDGSHRPMQKMFDTVLAGAEDEAAVDLAVPYQAARRAVFAECNRRLMPLAPGEAIVLHRHLVHGISPWQEGARAAPEGRISAYFRPKFSGVGLWAAADGAA